MVLSDLIYRLQLKNPGLPPSAISSAVRRVFDEISEALAAGGRVELRGVGSFGLRDYPGHEGRNPRTGDAVNVLPKRGLHWKTGKSLAEAIQDSRAELARR